MPSRNKDGSIVAASALPMYEHVFDNITSDDVRGSLDVVIRALSDPSLWDDDVLSWPKAKKDSFGCLRVRWKVPGSHPTTRYLHKIPEVAAAWDATYAADMEAYVEGIRSGKLFGESYVDVATGEVCLPISTQLHTKSFLVSSGKVAPILSFNDNASKAFSSYGFSGLDHGAVSFDTDVKLCAASDWLVNSRRFCYLDASGRGTRLFFWGENVTKSVVDNMRELLGCGSNAEVNAKRLLDVAGCVNVMEVRPNLARMSVRQVDRYRVRDLATRRLEWERHFDLAGVGSFRLGKSLYYWDEFDGHECCGTLCGFLRDAIVFGSPMPGEVLSALVRVVERDSAFCASDSSLKSMGRRAALMKAYLIESCGLEIGRVLMVDNDNTMYRLGRMIAVCDRAQYLSVGASGIRQRFVSTAAEFPRSVAADIMDAYTLYSSLLSRKNRGAFVKLDKLWSELVWFDGSGLDNMFPEISSDVDKLQLYLGYYHQMHEFFNGASSEEDVVDDSED